MTAPPSHPVVATPAPELPPLRDVIAAFALDARKKLGQHFLLDLNLTARIARAARLESATTVIEIGPGPGGLTRALLWDTPARAVVAVERDPRCIAALEELVAAAAGRLTLIAADALTVDPAVLAPAPRAIVANLPYNVGTPLLIAWLRQIEAFQSLTLMFQKEVADRLLAAPGSKSYGRLSVVAQWRAQVKPVFNLPAQAFTPPPKVASTVVRLEPHPEAPIPTAAAFTALETVTAAAFGQRRKMLRSSLRSLGDAEALLATTGISPTARAEDIPVAGFVALAEAWSHSARPASDAIPAAAAV